MSSSSSCPPQRSQGRHRAAQPGFSRQVRRHQSKNITTFPPRPRRRCWPTTSRATCGSWKISSNASDLLPQRSPDARRPAAGAPPRRRFRPSPKRWPSFLPRGHKGPRHPAFPRQYIRKLLEDNAATSAGRGSRGNPAPVPAPVIRGGGA